MTHLNYLNRGKFLARAEQGGLGRRGLQTLTTPCPAKGRPAPPGPQVRMAQCDNPIQAPSEINRVLSPVHQLNS